MSSLCEELCQCLCPCSKPAPSYRKRKNDDDDYDDAEAGHFQWSQQQYHGSSPLYEYAVRSKSPVYGDSSRYRGSNAGGSAQAAAFNKHQQAARWGAANSLLPRPYEEVPSSSSQQQQQRRPSYNNNDTSNQQQQQQTQAIPAIRASPDAKHRTKTITAGTQNPPPLQPQQEHYLQQEQQLHTLPTVSTSAVDISHLHQQRQQHHAAGLRGTQPLVSLNRLGMLSADLSSSNSNLDNNSSATTASSQPYQQPYQQQTREQPGVSGHPPPTIPCNNREQQLTSQQQHQHAVFLPLVSSQEISCQELIGGGAFGSVYRGSWRGTPVAIKVLSPACQGMQLPEKLLQSFEEEVALLVQLRHPNICLLLAICMEPSHRAIVTELVSRGSLWDALRRPTFQQQQEGNSGRDGPFHWPVWVIRRVLEGAGRGLIYLHTHNPPIIHRDLKSANLLLDDSFHAKICDFGLARLRDMTAVLTANVGTVQWMAPEVLLGSSYDEKVDVYSLALVLWEMLTGLCPYEGMQQVEVALAVINAQARPTIPVRCTIEQRVFLQRCWATNPEHRPAAAMLVEEAVRIFR